MLPVQSVIRLGSSTPIEGTVALGGRIIEINTIAAIANSANKKLMKQCFDHAGVMSADWFIRDRQGNFYLQQGIGVDPILTPIAELPYPLLAKGHMGSRGRMNHKFENQAELEAWMPHKDTSIYIFEKYYNFTREYRLHVTAEGCFYTCRKMLKRDAEKAGAWQRHDDNCVWFLETNPGFDKPANWDEIVENCKEALLSTELDIASFDVRVQSARDAQQRVRERCEFIIIECNSASSLGEYRPGQPSVVATKYVEVLPRVILKKAREYGMIPAEVVAPVAVPA
jgi:hypothetical protein